MEKQETTQLFPISLRLPAKFISIIFHPLFIPVYVGLFLIYIARLFPDQDATHKLFLVIQFFVSYTLLPLCSILLMKGLGLIPGIYLRHQKDRILPYVVCEIFYFWVWYVFKNQLYPKEIVVFALSIFLASCIGLIINTFIKVSMHAISVGVLIAFMIMCGLRWDYNYGFFISASFLIAGTVCTRRIILSDHTSLEVYAGIFIGIIALLISVIVV